MRAADHTAFGSAHAVQAPWDIGKPQKVFVDVADAPILDAECGTGGNTFLFAERSHEVTEFDFLAESKSSHYEASMTFSDHFSDHASRYKMLRPTYPDALFAYLATIAPAHDLAWDCATGNGQAAVGLTDHFRIIVATDASHRQIAEASLHSKVGYLVALAERAPLKAASVDLVAVAAALHWLDHERFYSEVQRVLRPGGVLACWSYHLQTVGPEVDAVVRRLYSEILGSYWFPETRHLEDRYRSLPFPFEEVTPPPFRLVKRWDLGRLAAYMGTWSGSLRFLKETGREAPDEVWDELTTAWGDPQEEREVVWDLHLRVGRIRSTVASVD